MGQNESTSLPESGGGGVPRSAASYAARWQLGDLIPLAQTRTSTLWRAQHPAFGDVVLKVLTPYGAAESSGFDLMAAAGGQGMAQLYCRDAAAGVIEYLPGPMLSGMVRGADDIGAAEVIAEVARAIGAAPEAGLVPLHRHLADLLSGDLRSIPRALHPVMHSARALCANLLKAGHRRALHGDLHHDNILLGPRGWLAIDARGLTGDPAYEFSNAFRNPCDCQILARDPRRIAALGAVFAARSGLPVRRILQWAVAHCAASLLWSAQSGDDLTDDMALLPVLFAAAQTAGDLGNEL